MTERRLRFVPRRLPPPLLCDATHVFLEPLLFLRVRVSPLLLCSVATVFCVGPPFSFANAMAFCCAAPRLVLCRTASYLTRRQFWLLGGDFTGCTRAGSIVAPCASTVAVV
ncbi:hypothetical protein TRVL_06086 [Trypanosoma vivax]|nr:hypothetical protein TRVL_06086 [Trypanosoma vivax]